MKKRHTKTHWQTYGGNPLCKEYYNVKGRFSYFVKDVTCKNCQRELRKHKMLDT